MTTSSRAFPVSRHVIFWTLAILGLAADLGSKHYMFSQPSLLAGNVQWVWPGHAGFQLSLNEGALFGMGQGGVWAFAACSIAAAIAIPVWLFGFAGARDAALTVVLGLILGGVLGNLYDRIGLAGLTWGDVPQLNQVVGHNGDVQQRHSPSEPVYAVRDFVLACWQWPPTARWHVWPNFNIADSLLVCGAIAILLLSLRRPSADAQSAK
jgi:signal peptidase II